MFSPLIYELYFVLMSYILQLNNLITNKTNKTKLTKITTLEGHLNFILELPPVPVFHSERGLQVILTNDQKASMTFFWREQLH